MAPKETQDLDLTSKSAENKPKRLQWGQRRYRTGQHYSRGGHVGPSRNMNVSLVENQREGIPNVPGPVASLVQGGGLTGTGAITSDFQSYFKNGKRGKTRNELQSGTEIAQQASSHPIQWMKHHKQNGTTALCVHLENLGNLPPRARELVQHLIGNTYECLNCLEIIKINDAIWSCSCCFNMFHLQCIRRWAHKGVSSSRQNEACSSFYCPQCRAEHIDSVTQYKCFCNKETDPPFNPLVIPHSCGNTCGKAGMNGCPHPCALQCHPGLCSECHVTIGPLACPCGSTTYSYRCGQPDPHVTCGNPCAKTLSCNMHRCERDCHVGDCGNCSRLVTVTCPCGKETQQVGCSSAALFVCGKTCEKPLPCGNHNCTLSCHTGSCQPCEADPSVVRTCPCGATPLPHERQSCLDPVPRCGGICRKLLECGRHSCSKDCHTGPCMPCMVRVETSCRCRQVRKLVNCTEVDNFQCTRECGTRLSCGRHHCKAVCCQHRNQAKASQHECHLVCGRKLKCGHSCSDPCHSGACQPCIHFTTEPLYCRCARAMLMPPQPCDAKPPDCQHLCEIRQPCGHPPTPHPCHYGDCPVCTYLVEKVCVGGHMKLKNIPCWRPYVTCPQKCNKLNPHCGHTCSRPCHSGPCVDKKYSCTHTCEAVHPECGHTCERQCHVGSDCPPCQHLMRFTCECGRISRHVPCAELRAQAGRQQENYLSEPFEILCDKDCLHETRLTILSALAKGTNTDFLSDTRTAASRLKSSDRHPFVPFFYSVYLWEYVSESGVDMVKEVESLLKDFLLGSEPLVSLPPAHAEKRTLIHSIAVFYKVSVESVDAEPKRSCLLKRNPSSQMPPILLSEVIKTPELYNPQLFISAVMASSRTGLASTTLLFPNVPCEAKSSDLKKEDGDLLLQMLIKDSAKGKSLLPQLGIYLLGVAVTEKVLMHLLSPEFIGSFVFVDLEECDDRSKALLIFTSTSKRHEGYKMLQEKFAPFQFWLPI